MESINNNWVEFIRNIREEVSKKPEFMFARESAENRARIMLNNKAGAFGASDLAHFLNLCNTEFKPSYRNANLPRGNEALTRFQLSFIGQNRKLFLSSLDSCNPWIKQLWEEKEDNYAVLSNFWTENQVPGAGTGLPTMILYLKDPLQYNVWLPFLNNAVSVFTRQKFSMKRNAENYLRFNDTVNIRLRHQFKLKPQEIDYVLYRINAESSKML